MNEFIFDEIGCENLTKDIILPGLVKNIIDSVIKNLRVYSGKTLEVSTNSEINIFQFYKIILY